MGFSQISPARDGKPIPKKRFCTVVAQAVQNFKDLVLLKGKVHGVGVWVLGIKPSMLLGSNSNLGTWRLRGESWDLVLVSNVFNKVTSFYV